METFQQLAKHPKMQELLQAPTQVVSSLPLEREDSHAKGSHDLVERPCGRAVAGGKDSKVLEMINNSHYLYRMTILNAISLLAPVMGAEVTCQTMLPVVVNAAKDRVPNIKFNVAKVLQSLIPVVDPTVVDQTIRPCLVELSEDPDVDVRYFAAQALQSCDQNMST
ncbi:hypothetical protein L7F22_055168 [Adiantum nelumboides]|nr:hypothetical protein [Adiantum nelumboides]